MKRKLLVACQTLLRRGQRRVDGLLAPKPQPSKRQKLTLAQAYETGWQDYRCVFVLSTGRGGTETLTALAGLAPRISSEHEPMPRLIKASFDAYLAGDDVARSSHWRDLVLAARDDVVWRANQQGKVYFESNNRLTYLAPVLAEVFPASRFIHLYREPYAFVRSAMRRRYFAGHNWDFARCHPRPGEPGADKWECLTPIDRCAWLWARVNGDAHRWIGKLAAGRGLSLRAEDLFAGRPDALAAFFALCDAEVPSGPLVDEVLGEKLNAQRHGEFPVASQWTVMDRDAVWAQVGLVAEVLGYRKE